MSEQTKKYSINADFSLLAILVIPVGVAVNAVIGSLVLMLKIPLYLDTIGTIFVAMLCGPWVGALTGILTNIILGITDPVSFAFIPVSIVIGLAVGFLARAKMFGTLWKWIISILLIAIISTAAAASITILVFGGFTSSATSFITAGLMANGWHVVPAVLVSDATFTIADRIISCVVSMLVIKTIPNRTLVKFGCGENYLQRPEEPQSAA